MVRNYIPWKDEYCVGNAVIDYDHQTLVNITNELFKCVDKGLDEEEIATSIKYLVDYVERHFRREEGLFLDSKYPDCQAHLKKHREIELVVNGIASQYATDPSAIDIDEVMQFLKSWLINHIMRTDRDYLPYLAN